MPDITIKEGEGKWISFTITRASKRIDCSSASGESDHLLFAVKEAAGDEAYLLAKSGESFDKTGIASGELRVNISATESAELGEGVYVSELKVVLTLDEDVYKSAFIPFHIQPSAIHT